MEEIKIYEGVHRERTVKASAIRTLKYFASDIN